MSTVRAAAFLIVYFLTSFVLAGDAYDPQRLGETGEATSKRIATDPVSWTVNISSPETEGRGILDIVRSGNKRRISLSAAAGKQVFPILTIIERDGLWYVDEKGGISGAYRPYEAPFNLPTAYQYLFHNDLKVSDRDTVLLMGDNVVADGNQWAFTRQLAGGERKMVEDAVKKVSDSFERMPGLKSKPQLVAQQERLQRLLDDGVTTRVDSKTGVWTDYGPANIHLAVSDFRFLEHENAEDFSIDGRKWDDHTKALSEEDLANTIMISHCAIFQPGLDPKIASKLPADIRLFNLKTQELRHLPVRCLEAGHGCFLKDRHKVVISAVMMQPPGMRLCEVDLISGKQRLVGASFPDGVVLLGPVVSGDGKTLAVAQLNVGVGADFVSSQIYLIDLDTDLAKPLGQPGDFAYLNWLPENKGLLIRKRRHVEGQKYPGNTVCRMDLDGHLTEIRAGDQPLMLTDGKSFLFEDENQAWHRCDLTGAIQKDLTDGSALIRLEGLSIDGANALGGKNASREKGMLKPIIFDPETGDDTPLTALPGLWIHPVGR